MVYCLEEAATVLGFDMKKSTYAVQGFGNAGANAAELIAEAGGKIVAISDINGAFYNKKGLDIRRTLKFAKENKGLAGLEKEVKCEVMEDPLQLLYLDVDILIPAALENQITSRNAEQVQAKIIAECANGPTSYRANKILNEKGTFIIPDILCNSGGVTVSYFEWVQNRIGYHWTKERVQKELRRYMQAAFDASYKVAERYELPMRTATYVVGIDRVATANVMRGL